MLPFRTTRGRSLPLGPSAQPEGVNFALLSRHGTSVWLLLEPLDGAQRLGEIALHPRLNRTGDHWHVLVAGLPPAFRYGWRVDGRAAAAIASTPTWCCSTRRPRRFPTAPPGASRSSVDPQQHGISPQPVPAPPLRLARGRAAADAAGRLDHLRAARPRLHLPSLVRRAASRHLRRAGGEDPLPEGAGRHRRRAAADPRVRRVTIAPSSTR